MGPDRSAVVADRVVSVLVGGEGSYPPSREHLGAHELIANLRQTLFRHYPGPQEVAHVRCHRVDLLLIGVEPDHVVAAALIRPERLVEPIGQIIGFSSEPLGQGGIAHEVFRHLRDPELGVVHVTLDLRRRDGQVGDPPVRELDAVP